VYRKRAPYRSLGVALPPWLDWYATQDGIRGALLCDRESEEKVRVEPPTEWGSRWRWNVTEDGSGVYFREE
jgi:hypothetical protein